MKQHPINFGVLYAKIWNKNTLCKVKYLEIDHFVENHFVENHKDDQKILQ